MYWCIHDVRLTTEGGSKMDREWAGRGGKDGHHLPECLRGMHPSPDHQAVRGRAAPGTCCTHSLRDLLGRSAVGGRTRCLAQTQVWGWPSTVGRRPSTVAVHTPACCLLPAACCLLPSPRQYYSLLRCCPVSTLPDLTPRFYTPHHIDYTVLLYSGGVKPAAWAAGGPW